ncbi:MAG: 4-(cytidine 5'-diphospho)-2-C-methyl-D-erythritol kinase [Chitinophagaceae bacterium]
MILFPNCKINLGLRILRKRSDGFHDIETFFYPFLLTDALEIIPASKADNSFIHLTTSGTPVQGSAESNLCVKAYNLLQKDYPDLSPVSAHLHKAIPSGAGLGGGSSNAAFTLKALDEIGQLNISKEKMAAYALQLGSDCPFFLINKPCYATGQGEQLEEYPVDLTNYKIMLVNPVIHVDTGNAFSNITPSVPSESIKEIIKNPITEWKGQLTNDFEKVVFGDYKEIADIKTELYKQGAIYASMSGSGSTVYGIFEKDKIIAHSFPADYFIKTSIG